MAELTHGHEPQAIEAAATAKVVHPAHTRTHCLNCDAALQGRYCHDCGQSGDDHHRSIGHLVWEAVEHFTHLDGRLGQTLPALLWRPGRLARDHIEGRRQRHVPPFRLFLITLLIFMLGAEFAVGRREPGQKADGGSSITARGPTGRPVKIGELSDADMARKGAIKLTLDKEVVQNAFGRWLVPHLQRADKNKEYFASLFFEWAHRLAILLLPILAAFLTLLYVYKREFYVYDHLVVAMQYLSFCFLIWAVVWLMPRPLGGWLFWPALAWTPFNLYRTLRGAYGSRRSGAALKALLLWAATLAAFGVLTIGLLAYALNTV